VEFIEGDFREEAVFKALTAKLDGAGVDLVLSDMAPNISGMNVVDQAHAMHLAELAMDFALRCLKPGGSMVVKLFQGRDFDEYLRELRARFARVTLRKPAASRLRSREVYALAVACKEQT
jgi:23S rRNA (uridine2552-2'-O)-methyltransferase